MRKEDKSKGIVILDFGGQYSQLIARRIRECHVYCEVLPYDSDLEKIKQLQPKGIIFSGGPSSVYGETAPKCSQEVLELNIPVLGICYGHQLLAYLLGGKVREAKVSEYGRTKLYISDRKDLFAGLPEEVFCWMSHGDCVEDVPEGFEVLARTDSSLVAAMGHREKKFYGVQFHPEVKHTDFGLEMLKNFLFQVCQCEPNWTMDSFIQRTIKEIKEKVGDGKALCALSGGVDSSVAAVLVHEAIGDKLTCVFVNHGLLRKGEADQVVQTFREQFKMNLIYVDASKRFLTKLQGVTDPEQKRKIIGEEFIRVFEEEASKLGQIDFLVQGTVYPDVIESGTSNAALIKSHHNVGGLPKDMKFSLIEPLRDLFKDEVREVGTKLGLAEEVVWRQPFPGPGLAIRIIGAVDEQKLSILREADAIVREEIRLANLHRDLWQYFVVLTSLKTVGVIGDERTYDYVAALRAVTSDDAMTADWARLPYEVLERISNRIVNEVKGISRLVYDITSKPPGTIEWE